MANFLTVFKKYKTSSVLNILGLTAAFAALYIILVQVHYDLTYNQQIKDSERVYSFQVPELGIEGGQFASWVSRPLAEQVISECPLVESYGTGGMGSNLRFGDFSIRKNGAVEELMMGQNPVSLGWLEVFNYQAVAGSLKDLANPNTAAISQATAKKYGIQLGDMVYSGLNPDKAKMKWTISAIFKDQPQNTDLNRTEFIFDLGEQSMQDRSQWSYAYFIKLRSAEDVEAFYQYALPKLKEYASAAQEDASPEDIESAVKRFSPRLVSIQDSYFDTIGRHQGRQGNQTTTYTLLAIAILVVVIALINFINFFFALVPIRIRSVNTKKVFGCSALSLRMGFIGEALATVFVSLILAWCCVDLIKSSHIASYISAPLNLTLNPMVLFITLSAALLIALAGSVYPSFYITSFPAAMVLKGSFSASKSGQRLRILLIGMQFTISMGLIISTLVIKSQHSFMMNYDMGFNKEMLLSCYISGKIANSVETRESFSNKLKQNPQIQDVAYGANDLVAESRMGWGRIFKGKQIQLQCMPVSWNFLDVMGIKMEEGRTFTREDEFKEGGTMIPNRQAAKEYDITMEDRVPGHAGPTDVAGICADFNFKPLQYGISPFVFYVFGKNPWSMPNHMYFRTTENADIPAVIESVKNTIMEFAPDTRRDKIEVMFFDQELGEQYEAEQRITTLITLFTVLSILISLMGVFGLVLFETQYRKREIGLRRVHGSTVAEILNIFNLKFVRIIAVCFVIAAPLSYLAVDRWLDSFAYRTPIHWWIFVVALLIVLAITVTLVSLRSLKAATDNPVDAIKAE